MAKPIQCFQVAFNQNQDVVSQLGGVQKLILHTNADCYVDFDQPTASTQSYKILASNTADSEISGTGISMQNLYVRGVSGTGTLYVVAIVS